MRAQNLVYLMYAPNTTILTVTDQKPPGVQVDPRAGTWTTMVTEPLGRPEKRAFRIGARRRFEQGCRFGGAVIGVYDRNNIEHLRLMVYATLEATREQNVMDD